MGRGVALLHYGERSEVLADALAGWGARVRELCLYEWRLPEDTGPLRSLIAGVVAGEVDALAFTSQVQLRHLLRVAEEMGEREALLRKTIRRTGYFRSICSFAISTAEMLPVGTCCQNPRAIMNVTPPPLACQQRRCSPCQAGCAPSDGPHSLRHHDD